jgi:hypothetical protein
VIDDVGATDREIVGGIWHLARYAVKGHVINIDGEVEIYQTDDNSTRIEALKTLAKMKGHLSEKAKKKIKNKNIKYVLIAD